MEKLPRYYKLIKSYEGKGEIHLSNGKTMDCDFECGQNEEGDIIVGMNTGPSNYAVIMDAFINSSTSITRVSGYTTVGRFLDADVAVWTHSQISSSLENSSAFLIGYANTLTVSKDGTNVPLNAMRAYLVNFEFISPFSWHFGGYDFAIERVKEYDENVREMHASKRPKLTAELRVTSLDNRITDVSEVEQILHDACLLLSLAKSCRIQWLYWDAYSADEEQTRSYHWNGRSSPFGDWPIIKLHPPKEIGSYLSQVLQSYRDVQKEGIWQFDQAINHFVDTASSRTLLELKAINLVVLTDYLTQLFAKHKKVTYSVEQGSFADKKESLQEAVRKILRDVFSTQDLVENEYLLEKKKNVKKPSKKKDLNDIVFDQTIQEVSAVIDCLNRRSFKSLLKRLLKDHLNLEVDKEELDLFIKIRNKLVHEASFLEETDFVEMGLSYESPPRQFCRILSLTSRIMLAILKYRGYYHDWSRFKLGEWAGSDVSTRVKMPY